LITSQPPLASSQDPAPRGESGWIVSPGFDLLFLANAAWPILLLPVMHTTSETAVDFWQVYFLTLPHRWITLGLVALDPDRRARRKFLLWLTPIAAALLVLGVWWGSAAFTCLALVDYIWNAWHFAAQHAGVLRMYSRKVGGGPGWLERHALRGFLLYTILRTAAWTTGWLQEAPAGPSLLALLDHAVFLIPFALFLANLLPFHRERIGKLAYLCSLSSLYCGLLLSLTLPWPPGIIVFTTASSMFHAVEYLAVVTHYATRRRVVGSAGLFRSIAGQWLFLLVLYIVLLGSLGTWLDRPDTPAYTAWQGLNLWAAFVHYAYDGLIWKLRQPATAQALGLSTTPIAS
jgi:hypothetical protein